MTTSFNEIINVIPRDLAISDLKKGVLASSDSLKAVRLPLTAGEVVAEHKAMGDIAVVCLAGHVDFNVGETTHHLEPGDLVCLTAGTLHSVNAVLDSVLLVTLCLRET